MSFRNFNCLEGRSKPSVSVKYSPSGRLFSVASADKKIYIFNSENGQCSATLDEGHSHGVNDIVWVDDRIIASGSDDHTVIVWDVETKKSICNFKGSNSFVYCLSIFGCNKMIVAGESNGNICFYHLSSKDPIMCFGGHSEPVSYIDCHNNGREFISAGQDGLLRVWDSAFHACCLKTIICNSERPSPFSSVRYSPNAQYVLTSSLDSTHNLYSHKTFTGGEVGQKREPSKHLNPIPSRSFNGHIIEKYSSNSTFHQWNDINCILSGSEDGKVFLWDLNSTNLFTSFTAHEDVVMSVASHPSTESSQFVSACRDGSVKIWNHENPEDNENNINPISLTVEES